MDNEKDDKIKQFITKDKNIPEKINNTFDNFLEKVRNNEILQQNNNVVENKYQKEEKKGKNIISLLQI